MAASLCRDASRRLGLSERQSWLSMPFGVCPGRRSIDGIPPSALRRRKKENMLKGLFASLAAAACLLASPAWAGDCFRFGATVTLAGRYAPAVLGESVNGNSDPGGVAGRTANLLILDSPLCVSADVVSAGVPAAVDIQLHCAELPEGSGKSVSLTGMLVGAHTGNGHTPVLLVCEP
jgi:hypothetical protein